MILYRTAGPWGPGAGGNLTAAQVDGNFYDVSSRVQNMELNPPEAVQIASFSAVGNQLYIYMTDGTVQGPMTLPTVRWFFRGQWTPGTVYSPDDVVNAPNGATYLVLFGHTSGPMFDPGANDGLGHDFYSVLFEPPAAIMPAGGPAGTVLTKSTDNNYDMVWVYPPPPPGGNTGQVLTKFTDDDGNAGWRYVWLEDLLNVDVRAPLRDGDYLRYSASNGQWINQPRPIFNVITGTSWAPIVGDEGSFMVLKNGSAQAKIFIPRDDVENFQIGSELHVHQDGTGPVIVEGDPGVNILKHASFSTQLLGQYATATIKKTANYEWRLFGLLAGA